MGIFSHWDDDEEEEDCGSIMRRDHEERKAKRERAKEIASGLVLGTFERDEEVWEMVHKIKDGK